MARMFQSSPAREGGRFSAMQAGQVAITVSILARP